MANKKKQPKEVSVLLKGRLVWWQLSIQVVSVAWANSKLSKYWNFGRQFR